MCLFPNSPCDEKTGGIARIKGYGRQPNVLSQQLTFRFPNERTFTIGNGENVEEITTNLGGDYKAFSPEEKGK